MRERKGALPPWIFIATLAALTGTPAAARADLGVIVPSYFRPGQGGPGGVGDGWTAMAAAASQVHLTAILNPNNGPFTGPSDPNYVDYVPSLTSLEAAGGKVVAYVYTDYGNRDGTAPIATVESQISAYISQYGNLINGFFLDGMFILPSTLSYYQSLDAYIKGLDSSYTVIGNPGQPYLNGVSPADYLSTADIFNIFEGTHTDFSAYLSNGVNWYRSYPSGRFSNTIYDASASDMFADVTKAYQANAGYVYVTDQGANGSNPYGALPSYWDQEVAALASVPEPSASTIVLAMGGLFGMARFARRLRDRARG